MSSTRGATDKPALRRAVLSRRAALGEEQRARAAAAALDALLPLVEGTPGGTVAAYLAVGTEPGTAGLLAALADRHVRVLLPVLLPDHDLDWASAADGVQPGPYGLLEPAGPRLGRDAVADCSLIVVPALAVDRAGHRLGRGGGSYDRALPRTHGLVVALLHDGESVVELPAEPHDAPVDALVTPSRGLVRLREREGESA
ncbi:MAG: 5-formyltetrahydrofolate cyclo-ligase [Frankiales bacterium]|nr:MAG: 5-formyltetrahydrofolate cyclo-ligase [Frankiales bacterium]